MLNTALLALFIQVTDIKRHQRVYPVICLTEQDAGPVLICLHCGLPKNANTSFQS